jgi:hypothetical protein
MLVWSYRVLYCDDNQQMTDEGKQKDEKDEEDSTLRNLESVKDSEIFDRKYPIINTIKREARLSDLDDV